MKTMLSLVVTLIALLCLSSLALALPDSAPDVMGIYFDPDYLVEEHFAPANVPFEVYVVLSNPTQAAVQGFEFGYDHWVAPGSEGSVLRLATNLPDGIIIIDPPLDPFVGSYTIILPTPIPGAETVVLLSWEYMLLAPGIVVHFNLTEAESPSIPDGLPGYVGPEGFVPAGFATTCFGTGARVNEFCPLPTEPQSWGTLKGLYR